MRICIRRRPQETCGTCVEIEADDKRLVLDVGLPLDADDANDLSLYPVKRFGQVNPSLLGVCISTRISESNLCLRICRVAEIIIDHD